MKVSGIGHAGHLRGIIPQPSICQVAHAVVRQRLQPVLDAFSCTHGLDKLVLGSKTGDMPMCIPFTNMMVLEKGRDSFDQGAIASADMNGITTA